MGCVISIIDLLLHVECAISFVSIRISSRLFSRGASIEDARPLCGMSSVLVFSSFVRRVLFQNRKTHFGKVYGMQGRNDAFFEIGNGMRCLDDAFLAII